MAPITKLLLLVVIYLFLLPFCCGCIDREREALLRIKTASDNSSVNSWENETDCCDWFGIYCNNATQHVVVVSLFRLIAGKEAGIIWQSLCTLTFVEAIFLFDSEMSVKCGGKSL